MSIEVNLCGIYVSPFALELVIAGVLFAPLRWLIVRNELHRWVWHPPLFDVALFIILLSLVNFLL